MAMAMTMTATAARAEREARRLLQKATNHGRFMVTLASVWALPTILAISLGAFVKLAGVGLPDWLIDAVTRAATVTLLIGGDLALIVALLRIGDGVHRGIPLRKQTWDILVVAIVGSMETWTFYLLLAHLTPDGPTDLMRAAQAIMTAAYLGTLHKRAPSERDVTLVIGQRSGEKVLEMLEGVPLSEADMGGLYDIMHVSQDETLSYGERAKQLVAAFERLAPGSVRKDFEQRITETRQQRDQAAAQLAQVRRQLEETISRANAQLSQTQQQAMAAAERATGQGIMTAMLHVLSSGTLPPALVERYPELANIDVSALANAGRRAPRQIGERGPRNEADRQRKLLTDAGVERIARTPDGKTGVWISGSDVEVLTGGQMRKDDARERIKLLPGSQQSGRTYVGRFRQVMEDLLRSNLLTSDVRIAYESLRDSGENDSGDVENIA